LTDHISIDAKSFEIYMRRT